MLVIAGLIGVAIVTLPWVGRRGQPNGVLYKVGLLSWFGFPAGVGVIVAAAVSSIALRAWGNEVWWGVLTFLPLSHVWAPIAAAMSWADPSLSDNLSGFSATP